MNKHDIRDAIEAGKRKADEATRNAQRAEADDFEPDPYEPVIPPVHRTPERKLLTRAERLAAMEKGGRRMPELVREVFLKEES